MQKDPSNTRCPYQDGDRCRLPGAAAQVPAPVMQGFRNEAHALCHALPHTLWRRDWMPLSQREMEVFLLALRGLCAKETARILSISPRTAETHRSNILRKTTFSTWSKLLSNRILTLEDAFGKNGSGATPGNPP